MFVQFSAKFIDDLSLLTVWSYNWIESWYPTDWRQLFLNCSINNLNQFTRFSKLGYRIFRGYKELCNAAERLPGMVIDIIWTFRFARGGDVCKSEREREIVRELEKTYKP